MTHLSLPLLLLTSLCTTGTSTLSTASKHHAEQSVVVLYKSSGASAAAVAPTPSPPMQAPLKRTQRAEEELGGSMAGMSSLLATEQEVLNVNSPKAELQRKLVSLIWLERVLQKNLDSMDEKNYRQKIAQSKAGLEKDTTPATAEMLGNMRTEMHEFSTPFFQKAVKDELNDIRARQKVILDKIIAIDAGETPSPSKDDKVNDKSAKKAEEKVSANEVQEKQLRGGEEDPCEEELQMEMDPITNLPTLRKRGCGNNARKRAGLSAKEKEERAAKRAQSNIYISVMILLASILGCILVAIAIKVTTHQSSTR